MGNDEDVEDHKKSVDIVEAKLKEIIQPPPLTVENCQERDDGDLQWDEISFSEEVNGKYWQAVVMGLHRIKTDFTKNQRKIKQLESYLAMKNTSDKRNPKYYA